MLLLVNFSFAAADPDLSKELTDHYGSKILVLRHALTADSQHYDAEGKPLDPGPEGSWTIFGRIIVNEIFVESNEVRVSGKRTTYVLDGRQGHLVPHVDHRHKVEIAIRLDRPLASSSDAEVILGRVFAQTSNDVLDSAPSYWRRYLEQQAAAESGSLQAPQKTPQREISAGPDKTAEVVALGHKGVSRPNPEFTPEPDFTEAARKARYQGVVTLEIVVDKQGRVSEIQILKPLGFGLDDNAAQTVKTWRFSPAKVDGQPTACTFNVEVDFHLYDRR